MPVPSAVTLVERAVMSTTPGSTWAAMACTLSWELLSAEGVWSPGSARFTTESRWVATRAIPAPAVATARTAASTDATTVRIGWRGGGNGGVSHSSGRHGWNGGGT